VGAGGERRRRRGRPRRVVGGAARGADAGWRDDRARGQQVAERADLTGRGNAPVEPRGPRSLGEVEHVGFDGPRQTEVPLELGAVEAREDRDAETEGAWDAGALRRGRGRRRPHHRHPAARVDGEHAHPEPRRGADGARHRGGGWRAWAPTDLARPGSRGGSARSRLVRTVTPRQRGRGTPGPSAAAAAAAARIIVPPPLAWTVSMRTPSRVAARTAPATVFGMSWNFRSRKTRKPRLRACSTAPGPAAGKSWAPILQAPTRPASRSSRRSASASPSTSRATRSRSSAVTVVLLQRADRVLALPHRL